MPDKLFLDTNILVYLSNEDSPFHQEVTKTFLGLLSHYEIWISRQVLREYAVVMSNPAIIERPLKPEEVTADLEKWNNVFNVADETSQTTEILIRLIKTYNLRGKRIHDANIVATMIDNSINFLYTLNISDFKLFDKIQIIEKVP